MYEGYGGFRIVANTTVPASDSRGAADFLGWRSEASKSQRTEATICKVGITQKE